MPMNVFLAVFKLSENRNGMIQLSWEKFYIRKPPSYDGFEYLPFPVMFDSGGEGPWGPNPQRYRHFQ